MKLITNLIRQDITIATRKGSGIINMLVFYIMASTLFVFGVGPDLKQAAAIAPAVIWVLALMVQGFNINRIFADDFEDGTLVELLLQGGLPEKIILSRIISNWLSSGFLIIIFAPFIAVLFGMEGHNILKLIISLICGTPALSIISIMCAAFTLGIRKAGAIFGILSFPLYVPVLIFGASWVGSPSSFTANVSLLIAITMFMLPLGVFASTLAIKAAVEEN